MGRSERSMQSFSECYIGWAEGEASHIIYDSRHTKRATAIAAVASDYDQEFKDVRCVTTYCRWRTRQERWDDDGAEQWRDDQYPDDPGMPPPTPPDDWEPDEEFGAFEECDKTADGAVKCWKVATGL